VRERPALKPLVAEIVARHTRSELTDLFDRIDIPFAPVAKPGDLFEDPQLNFDGRMLDTAFPNGTRAKIPRLPVEIGDHNLALRRQAPAIGEHSAEILAELGFTPAEIAGLCKRNIITAKAGAQA
jgi:crotonobetainyl-CoA:carnitine CoA-transferase CaiB-like acyl-CoA transferase